MIKKLNLDSIELRRKVKKLKLMHSIASQKTFLSNAIKQLEEIELNSNLFMHASNHMQYHSFLRLLISEINSQLQC